MATRTVSRTDLVGVTSLSFIRPQIVSFNITKTKPLTQLYAFFDGTPVDQFITPSGGVLGGSITTDAAGAISGTFSVPAFTFNTGERILRFQDEQNFEINNIAGNTVGSASAKFTANGLKQTFQTTVTNITDVIVTITNIIFEPQPATQVFTTPSPIFTAGPSPAPGGAFLDEEGNPTNVGDPLAQTFFTYGVTGGCFLTKLDIWFQSKDSSLPVTLEIRNVVNGYPGPNLVSKWSSVTLPPSAVNISNNSSVSTTFTFTRPIYLQENKDYCFVLLANSNKYNVWTSKFGDESVENGTTIFEQPYIGSLFKSENNITWTAEQTEDIKFKIYKADFDISTPYTFTSKVNAPPILIRGSVLSVTSGSAVVSANLTFQHGYKTGDKILLSGVPNATYRGISESVLSNPTGFTITVISPYSFTFNAGVNATSTGTMHYSGILNYVDIDNAGTGYVAPVATVSGGGASTQATLSLTVVGGKISGVTVLTQGVGYISQPTITITDVSGSGGVLTGIADSIFSTAFNRKFQNLIPVVFAQTPPSTNISNLIKTSDENYVVGLHENADINVSTNIGKPAIIATQLTDVLSFGGNPSTEIITTLTSGNTNVSPMIDLAEKPRLLLQNYLINNNSNSASELTPSSGTSYSRYLSRITTIETVSTGVRVIVSAASIQSNSFEVFFRTSLTSNNSNHKSGNWVKLSCDTDTNLSVSDKEFKDYLFYKDSISPFDAYDLKIVLYSDNAYTYPTIDNYRSVILAT
jgi:hypothetical protein